MGFQFLNLTICLLQGENDIRRSFKEWKMDIRFYNTLQKLHENLTFTQQETMNIINLLFNVTTKNEYYFILEKKLFFDSKDDIEIISKSLENQKDVMKSLKYINITFDYLMDIIVKILFEWRPLENQVKIFFLKIINKLLHKPLANAITCGKVQFFFFQ